MHFRPFGADSLYTRLLPMGCRHCRRGAKMVLFITGLCDFGCFYCPLSREKKGRDVVYANELRTDDPNDVLEEATLIRATGTGITGGDPLSVPERTLSYIRLLKTNFGTGHHIHLYTSTIDGALYQELARAGLDELRIHPMMKEWNDLDRTGLSEAVSNLDIEVGFEVPAVPGHEAETRKLIRFASENGLDFVNLNELEFSETNAEQLLRRGFEVKNDVSAGVRGSEEMAVHLTLERTSVPMHYCCSSFKDKVQLRNRIMRRARSIADPMDIITSEGMILKGVIESNDLATVVRTLTENFDVPEGLIRFDRKMDRIEVASWVLQEIAKELPWTCYLVEEYPTADRLEVEREPLNSIKIKRK
jgi:pyruvate formate-lyase activating enzyme-like uncharacterized protein